jgi:hypothetical protein
VSVATDWIPKELSVVARPATAAVTMPPPVDAAAARERISDSLAWLRRTADHLRRLGAENALGLFGTSIAGTWLAAEAGNAISFFVDEDPNRVGRTYLGRPVYAPANVPAGTRVFVGLPSAVAAGICNRLAMPGVTFIPPG